MNIGKMIAKRRQELGLTLEQVGNAVGVSKSTVKKWENGFISNMRRDRISSLANILQMNPVTLVTGMEEAVEGYEPKYKEVFVPKMKKVPLLGKVACGEPIYSPNFENGYALLSDDFSADFALEAKGDSMTGAHIEDGDIVYFVEQDMVDNGQIAAVVIEDEVTLKRVYYYREKNKLVLQPENPKYDPLVYMGEELDHIRIIGLAVAHLRRL